MTGNTEPISPRERIGTWGAAAALTLLAVLGNIAHLPLFFGVDLIFGSVATLVALAWLGPTAGLTAAAAGSLYTVFLWGHPYALVIFLLEAAVVGVLIHRGWFLVMADAAFWVVAGAPLALLLYADVLGMDWTAAVLIALKQPINGVFNAVLASFVLLGLQAVAPWGRARTFGAIRFHNLLFSLFMAIALIPGVILIVTEAYNSRTEKERALAQRMQVTATFLPSRGGDQLARKLPTGMQVLSGTERNKAGAERPTDAPGLGLRLPPRDSLPAMVRWKQAQYVYTPSFDEQGVRIVAPAEGLVERMRAEYRRQLGLLVGLTLMAAVSAALLSRWLTRPLDNLNRVSTSLPERINTLGPMPTFPNSRIADFASLISAVEDMATALRKSLRDSESVRASLEKRVRERTEALERNNAELQRLAEVSAHHLQEPVRRSLINAQRLRRNPERGDKEWATMEGELRWMSALIGDLQGYLAIQGQDTQPRETPLGSVVQQALRKLPDGTEPIQLTTDPDPLPTVWADPRLLAEALQQLLANAARFRRPGIPPQVHIGLQALPDHWAIAVTDNGKGMDNAFADRIFRLFERLSAEQTPEGTGLGLALVQRIVEGHGGEVSAESPGPNQGTTVRFTLPTEEAWQDSSPGHSQQGSMA